MIVSLLSSGIKAFLHARPLPLLFASAHTTHLHPFFIRELSYLEAVYSFPFPEYLKLFPPFPPELTLYSYSQDDIPPHFYLTYRLGETSEINILIGFNQTR